MKFKLKLIHNNVTVSLECVKIKKYIYIYIYIYSLKSQIMVYVAWHRVRIFYFTPSIGWCL